MRPTTLMICALFALSATTVACGDKKKEGEAKPVDKAEKKEEKKELAACPANFNKVKDDALECTCKDVDMDKTVWGTGIYTGDSGICKAAVHAGAIDAKKGGDVKLVKHEKGCPGYKGSEANGVKTNAWGKFGKSFSFDGHGDGACQMPDKMPKAATLDDLKAVGKELKAAKDAAKEELKKVDPGLAKAAEELDANAAKTVEGMKEAGKALEADINNKLGGAATALKGALSGKPAAPLASDGDCGRNFRAAGKDEVTCTCGKAEGPNGVVYGAHPFTADSSICAAARVLGLVGADGGKVTAKAAPGCPNYKALKANGITTRSWANYPKSFTFPAKGAAECPKVLPTDTCPSNFKAAGKADVTCMCAPKDATGSLYGSHPYTTDSSICKAAKHAGILKDAPVSVTAKKVSGCDTYLGTEANGVKSSKWGKYPESFGFASKGAIECPKAGAAAAPAAPVAAAAKCPSNFKAAGKDEITCSCEPAAATGSLYGAGPYTTDSSICKAAKHAGILKDAAVTVTAKKAPGCPKYLSTEANGIKSSGWSSYPASFVFASKPAQCPAK